MSPKSSPPASPPGQSQTTESATETPSSTRKPLRFWHFLSNTLANVLSLGSKHSRRRKPRRSWLRSLRYFYYRFVRLRGSPEAIARGLSAGVFAGCFPLFGFQTLIGIAIAAIVRGNKLMAAAGTWISNPFTYVPIYAFNLWIGQMITGIQLDEVLDTDLTSWEGLMHMGAGLIQTLFIGSAVVGLVAAIAGYFGGLRLVQYLHYRRHQRRHQRWTAQQQDSEP